MKKLDINPVPLKPEQIETDEERKIRLFRENKLRELGVYTCIFTEKGFQFPVYTDGIHNYKQDASLARELVYSDKEIPDDLKERLEYYKVEMNKTEG